MRIFVTGGTGFVGSHVVGELLRENELLLLSRNPCDELTKNNVSYVDGGLSSDGWHDAVRDFSPEVVIHLAWDGIPDLEGFAEDNFVYGKRLVDFCSELSSVKKLVVSGSCLEYQQIGDDSMELTIDEESNRDFSSLFSKAKNDLRQYIISNFSKEYSWATLFYVYGVGQRSNSLIPSLIAQAKKGVQAKPNNLFACNDYVYVKDVARAIKVLSYRSGSGTFNISGGELVSNKEVANIINEHYGLPLIEEEVLIKGTKSSINKMRLDNRWQPLFSFRNNLKNMLEED